MELSRLKLMRYDSHNTVKSVLYVHEQAEAPDVYRGTFRDCDYPGQDMGQIYADNVRDLIQNMKAQGKNLSCFIAESMQSCGGQIVYPPGYLQKVYQ